MAARRLVETALNAGTTDNVGVVVVDPQLRGFEGEARSSSKGSELRAPAPPPHAYDHADMTGEASNRESEADEPIDGEASDDDAYEGGLTGAVQLTVATDDDQLLTAATDDDQFEATLGGDLTWKKPKESTVQGCTCEGEEWTYSPWEDDYQGSTDEYRATTSNQQNELDLCEIDDFDWVCWYGYEYYVWNLSLIHI